MVKIPINSLSDNSNKKKLFLGMCLQVFFITVLAVSLKVLKYKYTLKNFKCTYVFVDRRGSYLW